jgi:beta-galactosidase
VTATGTLSLPELAPQERAEVPLRYGPVQAGEAFLNVRTSLRRATAWAPRGHVVAWDQLVVRARAPRRSPLVVSSSWRARGRSAVAELSLGRTDTVRVVVDRASGEVRQLQRNGSDLLASNLDLQLWRGPTDNDGIKLWDSQVGRPLGRWRDLGIDRLERRVLGVEVGAEGVSVHSELQANGSTAAHERTVALAENGDLVVTESVSLPDEWNDLPRLGTVFTTAAGFETLEWYGRGPEENETDRNRSAMIGRYHRAPDVLPYLMPQDYGTRTDVRWFAALGSSGGLVVVADGFLATVSAVHHSAADLTEATDWLNLHRQRGLVVSVDVAKRGVGTASCGPDTHPRYRLPAGNHTWRLRLRTVGPKGLRGALSAP